jgi:membrane associated rhomboid family serine protease
MHKKDLKSSRVRHICSIFNHSLVAALVVILLCIVFFFVGAPGLSKTTFASDGWVVLFTFMFAHENIEHFIINFAGLVLVGLLGESIGFSGLKFILIFFAVGFAVVPVILLMSDTYVCMGASAGIYGLLGAEAIELGQYMLSPVKFFIIFALASTTDSVIRMLFAIPTAAVQGLIHFAALSLGSVIVIYRSASAERSDDKK